jgi:tetratricopeptide (TPR) repeat protein
MKALVILCALAGVALAGPKGKAPAPKDKTPAPKIDPTQAKADALFENAQASYQSGQYQEAIEQFKQAYELVKDPVYLFNVAQSYRKVADCISAHDFYTQYLQEAPTAENKDKVNQWLSELQPCVDQRHNEQDAARHAEEAERQRKAEEARRAAEAAKPVPTEVDHGKPLRIAGIATGTLGLGALTVGIVYGIKSQSIKNDIATMCDRRCQWDSNEIIELDAAGMRANQRAKIGYIAGGVATVVGAGLYVFGRTRVETVMVTPNTGGATVSAQLSF